MDALEQPFSKCGCDTHQQDNTFQCIWLFRFQLEKAWKSYLWRKQFHESGCNSHESEVVSNTNSILKQRQVGCW